MSLGPIMMDVSGYTLTDTEKSQLAQSSIGGVILFTRNFESIEQVKSLIKSIRDVNKDLLIAVDHEGGRVQRFREGFTQIPAMGRLGILYDQDPDLAIDKAFSCGFVLAYELLDIDIDFSFAPVLDLDYGNSEVIGDRAFHSNPEAVVKLASSFVKGMHEAGMKSVGKHFPGHGFVSVDSHIGLPVDEREMDEIRIDIEAFKGLIDNDLDGIMPAHVIYSKVDDKPAGFSEKWIKDILISQLGFAGVIFSDDLSMQGAHFIKDIDDRVDATLSSGCDMALICNHPELVAQVIDKKYPKSEKLYSMKGIRNPNVDKIDYSDHLQKIQELL